MTAVEGPRRATAEMALALLLTLAAGRAGGQPLEEIIVLGSNLPADPQVAIQIIDRQTLELYGAAPLTQVLAQSAGLHVEGAGRGSLNSLYLRGADPNFTQIQIDGVPVNDPTNSRGGAYDVGALSAAAIERIEILPAAASALYGSQALAGVINIVTRQPGSGAEISLSADSRGGHAVALVAGGRGWSASAFRDHAGAEVDGSDYRSSGLAAVAHGAISSREAVRLSARVQDSAARAFPDDSGGGRYSVSSELERRDPREAQLDAAYTRRLNGAARLRIQAHYFDHREEAFTPAVAPGIRDPAGLPAITADSRYRRAQIGVVFWSRPGRPYRFALGTQWARERGASTGQIDFGPFQLPGSFSLERETASAFAEWLWQPAAAWSLSAGMRAAASGSETRLSPRINLERSFQDDHRLYASFGEGFKQPSFFALGQPFVGNPDLLDETSRSVQLGYRYTDAGRRVELALFANEFDELIDFESGPPPRLVNRDRVTTAGVEARAARKLTEAVRLTGSYVFVATDVAGSDLRLRNRPRRKGAIGLDWDPGSGWQIRLLARYVGTRVDSSIPTGERELSSYVSTDAVWQWQGPERMRFSIAIDNLFDRRYADRIGNPVAGTTIRFNLSYRI